MNVDKSFRWKSKLGVSVALFLLYGGFYVLVGVLTPFANHIGDRDRFIFMGPAAAEARYGAEPRELLAEQPILRDVRDTFFLVLGSLMFSLGVLVIALSWFGLRSGQLWALGALGLAVLVALPHYVLILLPYIRAGGPVVTSLPPLITIPLVVVAPAMMLGWAGIR